MNVNKFVDYSKIFKIFNKSGLDDLSDRLSFKFTPLFFSMICMALMLRNFLMKPLSCYTSSGVGGIGVLQFVEYYCFAEGTIPLDNSEQFPDVEKDWETLRAQANRYYSWIVVVFFLQLSLFFLPQFVWKHICAAVCGRNTSPIVSDATKAAKTEGAARLKKIQQIATAIEKILYYNRETQHSKADVLRRKLKQSGPFSEVIASKRGGSRLFALYMFIKSLYVANLLGQLLLLPRFLSKDPRQPLRGHYGLQLLWARLQGRSWQTSLWFPRAGFCLARLPQLGGINHAVAHCALPLSTLIETVYMAFWFWATLLLLCSLWASGRWLWRVTWPPRRVCYIKRQLRLQVGVRAHLQPSTTAPRESVPNCPSPMSSMTAHDHRERPSRISDEDWLLKPHSRKCSLTEKQRSPSGTSNTEGKSSIDCRNDELLNDFVENFLRQDGFFLLRMVASNAGEIFVGELIHMLWTDFISRKGKVNLNEPMDDRAQAQVFRLPKCDKEAAISPTILEPSAPALKCMV